MKKQFVLSKYILNLYENSCVINFISKSRSELLVSIILTAILTIPFYFAAMLCFLSSQYIYAIMFLLALALAVFGAASGLIRDKKRQKQFQMSIDNSGITHIDIDGKYFIPWDKVASFGIVNNNEISGQRNTLYGPKQICLYFSDTVHDEDYLRKKFNRIGNKRYSHCSNNEMIVLALGENDMEEMIKNELYSIIIRHCEKSLERSYVTKNFD